MTPSLINLLLSLVGAIVLLVPAASALIWVSQKDQVSR
ncbi:photosystem II reaction center X protein [Prochlorococcus sp. MIT 1341]|nr:photosystem II reaction center X protein [Prochlorococcus sp. MIT 1341]